NGNHLAHAVNPGSLGGHGCRIVCQHGDVDGGRAQCLGGGHALGGGAVELAIKVFGDDENVGHQSNPFSFSAATSSAASLTITPLPRLGGGAKVVVFRPWPASTARSAKAMVSSGLLLAFMMSGSLMK